jgi:hypothetical protein
MNTDLKIEGYNLENIDDLKKLKHNSRICADYHVKTAAKSLDDIIYWQARIEALEKKNETS